MAKTYKHPILGWVAKQKGDILGRYSFIDATFGEIVYTEEMIIALGFKEFIENKDWIDYCYDEWKEIELTQDTMKGLFRDTIEKHLPHPSLIKFKTDEVHQRLHDNGYGSTYSGHDVIDFLKSHSLLETADDTPTIGTDN